MTKSTIPDLSFITICYNGFEDTCELIESLQDKIHSVSYEIIVVDNASREDEAAKIRRLYPTVTTIRSEGTEDSPEAITSGSVRLKANTSSLSIMTPTSNRTVPRLHRVKRFRP